MNRCCACSLLHCASTLRFDVLMILCLCHNAGIKLRSDGDLTVRARLVSDSCDLMALFKLAQHLGHRCEHGCPFCWMSGQLVGFKKNADGTMQQLPAGQVVVGREGYSSSVLWKTTDGFRFGMCILTFLMHEYRLRAMCGASSRVHSLSHVSIRMPFCNYR